MKIPSKQGRERVLISGIQPVIDLGRYPLKRLAGESLTVRCALTADGHDLLRGELCYRAKGKRAWQTQPLKSLGNDQYEATIALDKPGAYEYQLRAWIDHALSWQYALRKKHEDGQEVTVQLQDGEPHLAWLAKKGKKTAKTALDQLKSEPEAILDFALSDKLAQLFEKNPARHFASESPVFPLWIDDRRAGFSAWYEFFPRSAAAEGHGTFKDVEALLPRVADLGFDVLYLPPIHPIGEVNRKGKNNRTEAQPEDVGSPWGIGSKHGGHKAIHPELGTLADYKKLIKKARQNFQIDIALDLAFQCAPDHPYVKEHPQWFKWRADGTVQYAENPPKKYQDILPIYFETEEWQNLWQELLSVITFWVEAGVCIFRVDNPHTKSINFWEWAIAETHKKHPEVIFLAEAFTKPVLMHQLAKAGFNQSYTYFTWRNFRHELEAYMAELTQGPGADYFRPNFWPNTPDILPYNLQGGSESLFLQRLFLAATLSSNYGVYGPVYELMVHEAVPGKEEYYNSEKYQISRWDWSVENKLTWLMRLLNKTRRRHPALQQTRNFEALALENQALMAYHKWQGDDHLLMVVNLDPGQAQEGWVQVPAALRSSALQLHDYTSGATYQWNEEWNYVRLDPALPFHLFKIERL